MIIGIIGYFTIPTVSNWIIQAGGMGNMSRNINSAANKTGSGVGQWQVQQPGTLAAGSAAN